MNDQCREVRERLEGSGAPVPATSLAHLEACGTCRDHARLLLSLADLEVRASDPAWTDRVMVELPATPWQRRRWRSWWPALGGLGLMAAGMGLADGLPAARAPLGLLPAVAQHLVAWTLDVATAVRGGGDAARALVAAGGAWLLIWLSVTAVGSGLAMRALARRTQ